MWSCVRCKGVELCEVQGCGVVWCKGVRCMGVELCEVHGCGVVFQGYLCFHQVSNVATFF